MLDGTIDGYESYETAVASQSPEPLDEERVAGLDMLYSSGTTGMPKGIARAFPNEPLEAAPGAVQGLLQLLFGMDDSKRYLSPAPLYHAAPLRFCLATHGIGATIVAMEHFDAEEYLRLVDEYDITHSQVVPTMFVRMLKLPEETRAKYDVSSLECVIHAAAPCPVPVKQQMIEWFGPVIHEYYAGSEGNGFVYCNSEGWLAHPGTVGSPINCVLHIVGEDGEEVPAGRVGHRLLRGWRRVRVPQRPGEDEEFTPPEGLEHARRRRLRRRRRVPVPHRPQGVHDHLRRREHLPAGGRERPRHPPQGDRRRRVRRPQRRLRRRGEGRRAARRDARRRATAASALASELIQFCRTQLADVKCPRSIDFRTELPRHPTGKLYKRLLKDEYWKEAGRSI